MVIPQGDRKTRCNHFTASICALSSFTSIEDSPSPSCCTLDRAHQSRIWHTFVQQHLNTIPSRQYSHSDTIDAAASSPIPHFPLHICTRLLTPLKMTQEIPEVIFYLNIEWIPFSSFPQLNRIYVGSIGVQGSGFLSQADLKFKFRVMIMGAGWLQKH